MNANIFKVNSSESKLQIYFPQTFTIQSFTPENNNWIYGYGYEK